MPTTDPSPTLPPDARDAILRWYDARGRSFPFRATTDPYAVLVLETMAQQTQIARAAERSAAFLVRFPTVTALAAASPADVLRAWRGLGYNRRALHLWQAAQAIVRDHDGRVPNDPETLERLPGIGPYTARAVAAFAFRRPVVPLDTNIRRVLGRVLGEAEPSSVRSLRSLQAVADGSVPVDRSGDWVHALMDIGATMCRPGRPDCSPCPLRPWCRYASAGDDHATAPRARRSPGSPATAPFPTTSRWLRGRLLDRLRDADGDGWVFFEGPLGVHDEAAILRALDAMAAEAMVERDAGDPSRARLRQAR